MGAKYTRMWCCFYVAVNGFGCNDDAAAVCRKIEVGKRTSFLTFFADS